MKSLFAGCTVLLLTVLMGCSQGTPGGPGATDDAPEKKKPLAGQADDTFHLSVPRMSTTLQQGEQSEVTVGIKRAKNFDQEVALKFEDIPQGVTIEPANPVIKSGDKDVKFTFTASDDASLGDFEIQITGHPKEGGDAKIEFKLTVAGKDSFTLDMPLLSTSLKQGETKAVEIGIDRDKTFDQEIALAFGELPTGVTLEPSAPVIKSGEESARVLITAADDASLGDFKIKVTGHPTKGDDAVNELKLSVVKE